jgi:hypothetical protein
VPSVSVAAHGKSTMAMEHCDCPPGKSTNEAPCNQDGGCSLDCLTHCGMTVPLATAIQPMRTLGYVPQRPALLHDSPGIFLSSIYPPYRPPQA